MLDHMGANAQRDDQHLLAPEEFTRESDGCARQPRVDQRLAQRRFVDLVELDQHGRQGPGKVVCLGVSAW
jgi:hypothetical protein